MTEKRIKFFFIFFIFLILTIISKLFYVQVIKSREFSKIADNQFERISTKEFKRGTIYDRNGNPLVMTVDVDSVYVFPPAIENPFSVARQLSNILDIDYDKVIEKITSEKSFVWIKRKIEPEVSKKIKSLNITGVGFVKEGKRFYLEGELSAHLLGIAGLDNQGLSGVEYYFNAFLEGKKFNEIKGLDGKGREIYENDVKFLKEETNSITLTIDKFIQYICERELEEVFKNSKSKGASIIVQDPKTGEILAMASRPTFNPNEFNETDAKYMKNPTVFGNFEPGSVFKIVTCASAFEEGLIKENDKIFCENGEYKFLNTLIRDHEKGGWLTFRDVMLKSSNIGFAKVGEKIGREKLWRYIRLFGFGTSTGIKLPAESSGIVRVTKKWSGVSTSRISFGQEISVTAIQLINAISCIANEGMLMKPQIVKSLEKNGKIIWSSQPTGVRKAVSSQTAQRVKWLLEGVVKFGTGKKAEIPGFRVCGKTGTAQKFDPIKKRYSDTKHIALFGGFLPCENPMVSILVIFDEPEGDYWGGNIAAPVFSKVGRQIIHYLKITPQNKIDMVSVK